MANVFVTPNTIKAAISTFEKIHQLTGCISGLNNKWAKGLEQYKFNVQLGKAFVSFSLQLDSILHTFKNFSLKFQSELGNFKLKIG